MSPNKCNKKKIFKLQQMWCEPLFIYLFICSLKSEMEKKKKKKYGVLNRLIEWQI